MSNTNKIDQHMIFASGVFLTTPFPNDFHTWDETQVDDFIIEKCIAPI